MIIWAAAHLLGAQKRHQADGAAALNYDGIAQLHVTPHGGVDANRERFGQHGHVRRAFGLEYAGVVEAQIDEISESAVEMGWYVGRVVEAVCAVAACAR